MGYYIDLNLISLEEYKAKLSATDLLPSRILLKDMLDERFDYFLGTGIRNVLELQKMLKKKDNLSKLSKIKCFSNEYLQILLREINSIQPKPNKIKEFSGISPEAVSKLELIGIKDTLGLFNKVKTVSDRRDLANKTGISESVILELTKLTDLSRIKWVGVSFARMLYEIGTDTVEKASKADFNDLHIRINQLNKELNFFRGQIGLNDMRLFVNAAKDVPLEIEY